MRKKEEVNGSVGYHLQFNLIIPLKLNNMKLGRLLILAYAFIIVASNFAFAQVKTKIFPDKVPSNFIKHKLEAGIINLSPPKEFVDLKNKKGENETRCAVALPVNINLLGETFRKEQDGKNIFSVTIVAKNALNISVEFSKFELAEGDVLSVFTRRELTDSITSNQNNSNKIWATRVYQGDTLTFMLNSILQKTNTKLVIGKINFGYKSFGVDFGNIGASANCHVNVICPEGNGWENERNSVTMIVANGQETCTGTLMMNSCNTNTPYILTANHCLQAGSVPNWVFQFQTWSTNCFTNTGWREDVQFNGCVLRANNAATDFALLELNQTPLANSGIFYSGWSREVNNITSTTVLHHPAGDLMKISRDLNPPVQGFWNGAQCWQLDLDLGHLQGGSSGGAYYNQNHQIIGSSTV
jgi:lysyl endopeptidase